ncbi:large conductance mechanosensitive channel protein [Beutenbergia cavernae DSM 12333]|uniref:Large-conductance mechanosensitive channel n=2 Tax=Beutenbergia TaxID=84756 RepID=C5BZI9_BEUC1|nr:large conductance mechanosensitive channel protein [Beutenbergia cavernae DSM 12333]
MLSGFKEFIARGNAVELAVGIVIGAAFTAVITAVVEGVLNPLIGGIFGQPNLDNIWVWTLNEGDPAAGIPPSEMKVGMVLTALVNFVLVAAAIYFLVVAPLNALARRRATGQEPEPAIPAEDIQLLTEIRDLLARQAPAGGPAGGGGAAPSAPSYPPQPPSGPGSV